MRLKIKKINPSAVAPTYATDGAACFDLYSIEEKTIVYSEVFGTGLSFEIPEGQAMFIYSRSGHGFNKDMRLAICVGVIDSDYRGEVKVKLTLDGIDTVKIKAGDRIAQAVLMPVHKVEFIEVEELSDTNRGSGGFGSTGS